MVGDLVYLDGPTPARLKEPEKLKIDVNAIRDGIEEYQHSIIEHLQGEVAALKTFIRSNGSSVDNELNRFVEVTPKGLE